MPITYEIDRSKDLTIFTLSGELVFEEFISTLNAYGKSGPTLLELYEARSLKGKRPSFEELNTRAGYLAEFSSKRAAGSKTAVLVSQTIDFGLSRMVSILTEGTTNYEIQVFREIEKAKKWLNENQA